MFVVDTNVLLHAVNADSPSHAACRDRVVAWREQPMAWYVTWGILYEFLRVSTHPRVFSKPLRASVALEFVRALLDAPGLLVLVETQRHAEVAALTVAELPFVAGNLVHDLHTAILMREHGLESIVTSDADFHRFPFLKVIDPLG